MKLSKLVINNFMSVREATLYLADKGLVSIEGINEDGIGADSNGSGKSTIINAILWCNYGEAGKDIKADTVVNKKAKKDCSVVCYWDDNETKYRVSRYRKHKIEKNNVKVELLDGKDWREISKAGASNVQAQINEILGQDYLTFQASCFAQQDQALDIPAMTDKGLKELLERVLPFEDLTQQYEASIEVSVKSKRVITDLEEKITLLQYKTETAFKNGKEALKRYKSYANDVAEHNRVVENKIAAKQHALDVSKTMLKDFGRLNHEKMKLKNEIAKIGKVNLGLAGYEYTNALEEYKKWKEMYDSADTSCALCKQETESKEAYRKRLFPNLRNLKDAYEKAEVKHLEESRKSVLLDALQIKLDDIDEDIKIHLDAEHRIARLRSEISLLEGQKQTVGTNPHTATVRGFAGQLQKAQEEKTDLTKQLDVAKAQFEIDEAVKHTFSPKGVRYHMLESVAPTLTERTNYYLNTLTDGAITARWSTVTANKRGEYSEKFKIEVFMDGEPIEYGAISGGEKRKVRLACFFGLQDLIAKRATKNIELWCGDEIDHALDPAGVERLMSVLISKSISKPTILVISHNSLKDWIPNTIYVTRKDDISEVKQGD